jgi:hypothetical protein
VAEVVSAKGNYLLFWATALMHQMSASRSLA